MNSDQLKALSLATGGDLYDHEFRGGEWMYHATETRESIEMFLAASAGWKESTAPKRGTIAGLPFVAWSKMQALPGQPRDALSVIDFGDVRVAVREDVTFYDAAEVAA